MQSDFEDYNGIGIHILLIIFFIIYIVSKKTKDIKYILMLIFFTLAFGISSVISIQDYFKLVDVLEKNKYEIVEGPIEKLIEMPYEGHQMEQFTVNGVEFEYPDYEENNAFHQTISHGSPIHENMHVKIHYYDGRILRLFIKK